MRLPVCLRIWIRFFTLSRSRTEAVPAVGFSRPSSNLKRVVFPAPFFPKSP